MVDPLPTAGRAPRIGLVLGGGGIAGYAFHGAVLAALEEATGFDPRTAEIIVGTSAGAIVAAVVRGNVPTGEMSRRLVAAVDDPREMPVLGLLAGVIPSAMPRLWAGPGAPTMALKELRRGRRLRVSKLVAGVLPRGRSRLTPLAEPLESLHPDGWPDRALWVTATNLRNGRLTVFGRDGSPPATVAQAVQASASLPVYFAPVRIDGRSYIDGGLSSPFNAGLLAGHGLDLVIVSAPLSVDELRRASPVSAVARSVPRRRLIGELRQIRAGETRTLVFEPGRAVARAMGLNPMDHRRAPAIVEHATRLVGRQLESADPEVSVLLRAAATRLTSPADVDHPVF